jgi:hypothetical protein
VTLWGAPAVAAEVVWVGAADPAFEAQVLALAKPSRAPLSLNDLLGADGDRRLADRTGAEALDRALQAVRAYESRLDGELVIMDDLERALGNVQVIANDADRERIFRALAYQGFAVHRFFEGTLASDPRAEPYRVVVNDLAWVRPWAQAIALDPSRELTPYDIAETPQRVAYAEQSKTYGREVLPGTLVLNDGGWAGQGGTFTIDGRPDASSEIKLLPGRHWVHLTVGGRVMDLARVDVIAGKTTSFTPAQTAATWASWSSAVARGETPAPDAAVLDDVRALGGEVWFVVDGPKARKVLALSVDGGWREVAVETGRSPRGSGGSEESGGLSLAAGLGVGWMYSGDFYTQNPGVAPHTVGTVNSAVLDLDLQAAYDAGPARVVVGLDTWLPPGEHHVALSGDGAWRLRPVPYIGSGIRYAQIHLGFAFPYHLSVGAAASVPVYGALEVQARAWYGLPGTLNRQNGSSYDLGALSTVQVGVGGRWRP